MVIAHIPPDPPKGICWLQAIPLIPRATAISAQVAQGHLAPAQSLKVLTATDIKRKCTYFKGARENDVPCNTLLYRIRPDFQQPVTLQALPSRGVSEQIKYIMRCAAAGGASSPNVPAGLGCLLPGCLPDLLESLLRYQ